MSEGIVGSPTYWRASMTMPRFLLFDARVIAAFVLLVFHLRIWTFAVLVATALTLWVVEHYGYRFPNALRAARNALAGRSRPAIPRARYRRMRDFGFETHPLTQARMVSLYAELARSARRREAMATAAQMTLPRPKRPAAAAQVMPMAPVADAVVHAKRVVA